VPPQGGRAVALPLKAIGGEQQRLLLGGGQLPV
jgi:hypothetical protein